METHRADQHDAPRDKIILAHGHMMANHAAKPRLHKSVPVRNLLRRKNPAHRWEGNWGGKGIPAPEDSSCGV